MSGKLECFHFALMAAWFRVRDLLVPPKTVLENAGLQAGLHVLDYGCGPGSYSIAAAELLGTDGRVYSVDVNPLAVQRVRSAASRRNLKNIETICSDSNTALANESVDMVLLYDTFHDLKDPDMVLEEIHRVLKPGAVLSFTDHHMRHDEIISRMTTGDLFELSGMSLKIYNFKRK